MNKSRKKKHSQSSTFVSSYKKTHKQKQKQATASSVPTDHSSLVSNLISIQPLEPLMIRDGRPFHKTPGIRAHTMGHLSPTTLAGTIRTMLYKKAGIDAPSVRSDGSAQSSQPTSDQQIQSFAPLDRTAISRLAIRGPLYRWQGSLYFPIPQDMELNKIKSSEASSDRYALNIITPVPDHSTDVGCYGVGRDGQLEHVLWPPYVEDDTSYTKPLESHRQPAYVSEQWMYHWLCSPKMAKDMHNDELQHWLHGTTFNLASRTSSATTILDASHRDHPVQPAPSFMNSFVREQRTHIQMDTERHTAQDQHLFSTESLVFPEGLTIEAQIESRFNVWQAHGLSSVDELHSLGGKRRLARFKEQKPMIHNSNRQSNTTDVNDFWQSPPKTLLKKLKNSTYLRLILATPAYFTKGWKPGWLNEELQSGDHLKRWAPGLELRLRWACLPRWQPVSGYATANGNQEKSIRRMVPAGSVYFFEVITGQDQVGTFVRNTWLKPISDGNRRGEAHDAEDGYGLALWGVWEQ
ncbi:type III-B CRISPR module-associated Cmr3 family protein [Paenibacillus sp. WLX2291]|uniref:type III-B CRISPR module-associated Cmr3 family protein n=1 Tax=Paenibacillus sp. WLX2291 TaxID=3296934 RepID=UPI003984516D